MSNRVRGTTIDHSGTITAGGTSQQLAAQNLTRSMLYIQNQSAGDLWINFTAAATISAGGGSIKIPSGADFDAPLGDDAISLEVVNIIGATTGQQFACKEL